MLEENKKNKDMLNTSKLENSENFCNVLAADIFLFAKKENIDSFEVANKILGIVINARGTRRAAR